MSNVDGAKIKKRRGPPPSEVGVQVVVRCRSDFLKALDAWIAKQDDPKPSRPEALRRLAKAALGNLES